MKVLCLISLCTDAMQLKHILFLDLRNSRVEKETEKW